MFLNKKIGHEYINEDNKRARAVGLKGDYSGTNFGVDWSKCTLSQKTQRQVNLITDFKNLKGTDLDTTQIENIFIECYGYNFEQILIRLKTLQGEDLDKLVNEILPPVGVYQ